MLRKLVLFGVFVGLVAAGILAYAFLRPTQEASRPLEAAPIPTATAAVAAAEVAAAAEATAAPETSSPTQAAPAAGPVTFQIDSTRSEARFTIDEVLNGAPKTVIGKTNQVAGQIAIDLTTPANTRVGQIEVNARTLTTDNEFRNRAIKNRILMTDSFEFIRFNPTAISGLPEAPAVGQPFTLQITGDLTIKDVTKSVTFAVQVTPVSETEIQGLASTTVLYADYNISIPEVPSVTGVDDNVLLEIDFVATRLP